MYNIIGSVFTLFLLYCRVSRDASQLDEMDTEGEEEVTERRVVVRVIVLDRQGRYVVKATSGVSTIKTSVKLKCLRGRFSFLWKILGS